MKTSNRKSISPNVSKSTNPFKSRSGSKVSVGQKIDGETMPDFEEHFPATCLIYKCPYNVIVFKEQQRDDTFHKITRKEVTSRSKKHIHIVTPLSAYELSNDALEPSFLAGTATAVPQSDATTIVIKSIYDCLNRLTEIYMFKVPLIPRVFIQVLGLYTHIFKQINKITIKRCGINVYTIHELSKILKTSNITEICLDDSPLPQSNYAVLLDVPASLKKLSLCRCNANDEVCKQFAAKLDHFAAPAARTLLILNLSTNQITDAGAKYLTTALRTNRSLRYLNLSGNQITDTGAGYIFDVLFEFPLTFQETIARRKRHIKYTKARFDLLAKLSDEIENAYESTQPSKQSLRRKSKKISTFHKEKVVLSSEDIKAKATKMVDEIMGPFSDPFSSNNVIIRDGYLYCVGNTVLSYLNFAYNNLERCSLKKLIEVITYQKADKSQCGLIKVVLEGNYLPQECSEMLLIEKMFEPHLLSGKYRSPTAKSPLSIKQNRTKSRQFKNLL